MGLLTDPSVSSDKSKYAKILLKYHNILCFALYLAGVIWFGLLADRNFNNGTYFSENALLPGLVYSEIKMDSANLARSFMQELEHERTTHRSTLPYAWIQAKMKQIGLETYTHNFTLNYPFGGGKEFQGKNIYGILRAPRIGSTEAIILSVPYRPPTTTQLQITSGLPLLLAFANFARKQKYWSKDIIFLVTDQEQLGMQAWLQAYHGTEDQSILNHGTLYGKAGGIIAAINFEIQDFDLDFINLKLEGLNGQLPNLDLHNLVQKLSIKQNIPTGYKMKSTYREPNTYKNNLQNLLSMMLTQSSGVPNGNHGLFHRYGIEALTIEGLKTEGSSSSNQNPQHKVLAQLKIVEGISRSLNNLLEKFHQSFFFYLIVSNDRFVSIGDYMQCLGLMAGSLLVKSFLLWLKLNQKSEDPEDVKKKKNRDAITVGAVVLLVHLIGIFTSFMTTNKKVHDFFNTNGVQTQTGMFYLILATFAISLVVPRFIKINDVNAQYLNIIVLLELGTVLLSVSLFNFSLGFFLAVIVVPFAIMMNVDTAPTRNLFKFMLKTILHYLIHPVSVFYGIIFVFTYSVYPDQSIEFVLNKSFGATVDSITFSVVDSLIYGNWLFDLISLILLPCWTIFWVLNFARPTGQEAVTKLKKN